MKKPPRIEYPYLCKDCKLVDGKIELCHTAERLFKQYGTAEKYQKHFKK